MYVFVQKGDFITLITPALQAETTWKLHQIKADISAILGRYRRQGAEDYNDYAYSLSGRYDLDYETVLWLHLKSEYRHEDRGALDDVGGV